VYERFIARQPILTNKLTLLGHELLFRPNPRQSAGTDANATSQVIAASTMLFAWEKLLGHSLGFINFGANELLSGAALLLPPRQTVVELPAELDLTEELIRACEALRAASYRISLDDFRGAPQQQQLLPLTDFIKVDFRSTSEEEQSNLSHHYATGPWTLVAKRVETWSEFRRAKALDFRGFQGFFFLEPRVMERRDIGGSKASAIRLLQAVHKSPLRVAEIEDILKHEPALTVKLLRYLNSPILARPAEVTSIAMAVALLGEQEFRRWATLVAVVMPAEEKPEQLVRTALLRAFFCEEIGRSSGCPQAFEFFLVGLLSLMNALLDQPLGELLEELAVSPRVHAALLGENNELRKPLEAVLAYERADWDSFSRIMEQLALKEEGVPDRLLQAENTVTRLLA